MKKFEIWAKFDNGIEVLVEKHKTQKSAQIAISSMNYHNQYELSIGYGFPYGQPTYIIKAGA